MEKRVHIFSSNADTAAIDELQKKMKGRGYEVVLTNITSGGIISSYASSSPVSILWITPETTSEVYDLGRKRNASSLTTINYFASPTSLNSEQKEIIGGNQTVFSAVDQESNYNLDSLCDILDSFAENVWDRNTNTNSAGIINEKVNEVGPKNSQDKNKSNANVVETEPVKRVNATNHNSNTTVHKSDSNPDDKDTTETSAPLSPTTVIICDIVFVLVGWGILNIFDLRVDDIMNYVVYLAELFFFSVFQSSLKDWRKINGKTVWSWIVLIITWYTLFCYIWAFFKDIVSWING